MALDLTNLIPIYQENIDALIEQMGRDVTLYFEKKVTNVNAQFNDIVRDDVRMPAFKAGPSNSAPTTVESTKTIKALVKTTPSASEGFSLKISESKSLIRLKTYLSDVHDLKRCSYIKVNAGNEPEVYCKYKMIREPIPTGLKVDRYAISYWEAM